MNTPHKPIAVGRKNLAAIALAISSALPFTSLLTTTTVHAAAPQVRTQAPGYYRMMLGDFEITAISDGTVTIPLDKLLKHTTHEEIETLLGREFLRPQVETSINTFLINTGSKLVLVDTGAGALFGPSAGGQLVKNLRAAGYSPEDIDLVLLTHIHGDHSGGLTVNGKAVFPNAIVRVDKHDSEFWLNPGNESKVGPTERHSFAEAAASLAPYLASGRVQPFDRTADLLPGIRSIPAPGHTPGHSLYEIESRGQKLVIWGDLIHAKDVQLPRPGVTIRFDVDEKAAASQRRHALATASRSGAWIAAAHISFPGIGHVRADGGGRFAWVPANYSLANLRFAEHPTSSTAQANDGK